MRRSARRYVMVATGLGAVAICSVAFESNATERQQTVDERVNGILRTIQGDSKAGPIAQNESKYLRIHSAILEPWRSAFLARDAASFDALLSGRDAALAWASSPRKSAREIDGVQEFRWSLARASSGKSEAKAYLAGFQDVGHVSVDAKSLSEKSGVISMDLRFDLRGTTKEGVRREDRGELRVEVAQRDGELRISRIEPIRMESIQAARDHQPTYVDATAAMGLDKVPVQERSEAIRRGGYAIASGDYDKDGRVDLLVGNAGPVKLYRNTEGGFVDVGERVGLSGETLVKAAAFADLDNDGHDDLIMLRFVEDKSSKTEVSEWNGAKGDGDLVAYRNRGDGTFERKANVLSRNRHFDRAMPMAIADFDQNGTLDVYIGYPGSRDFTNNLAKGPARHDVAKQGMWLNNGKWNFSEASGSSDIAKENVVYPHAAIAADLDSDGKQDLVVVDDSGLANPVYRNEGNGKFTNVTDKTGLHAEGWGMGASAGDFDGDGRVDVVMTNVYFNAYDRIKGYTNGKGSEASARPGYLFHNKGNGQFEEVADSAGLGWLGEAPAGAEWIDYNGDGKLDLYVMNGLWTGAGREDVSSFFMMLSQIREGAPQNVDPAMSAPGDPDPNPMLTILRNYKGSLANPAAPQSDKPSLSFAGRQRNCLFRNNGDGTFTEVGFLEGADRIEDGYIASVADLDNDAKPDLVLRNADPAPGVNFPSVVVLRNSAGRGNGLSVFPTGTKSNRNSVGAVITATVGDRRMVREIHSVSAQSQSEQMAFFGLGKAEKVDRLEVRWPSGHVDSFEGVSAGRAMVREGEALVMLPGDSVKVAGLAK